MGTNVGPGSISLGRTSPNLTGTSPYQLTKYEYYDCWLINRRIYHKPMLPLTSSKELIHLSMYPESGVNRGFQDGEILVDEPQATLTTSTGHPIDTDIPTSKTAPSERRKLDLGKPRQHKQSRRKLGRNPQAHRRVDGPLGVQLANSQAPNFESVRDSNVVDLAEVLPFFLHHC